MLLRGNIKALISRMERYQSGIPTAVANVMRPEKYVTALEVAANRTLKALAETEAQRALVPQFIATVRGEVFQGTGMVFTMHTPGRGSADVSRAQSEFRTSMTRETGQAVHTRSVPMAMSAGAEQNIATVRDAILQWVKTEKIKDERDAGLTDEEIADRLIWIMGQHPEQKFSVRVDKGEVVDIADGKPIFAVTSSYTAEMQAAGASLARVLQDWIAGGALAAAQGDALSPQLATQWLAAVLATWRNVLQERIRLGLHRELATLKHHLKADLL